MWGISKEQQSLRNKLTLPIFTYAHFAEHLAPHLLVPLLPFIRDYFGLTYFQAGMVISAYSFAAGVANLFMGWLADRVGSRPLLIIGIGGVGLFSVAIGLSGSYTQILVFSVLVGVFSGAYHPCAVTSLSRHFDARNRGRVLGLHLVGGTLSLMVGPILGGLLAELYGWGSAFIFLAIPCLPLIFLFPWLLQKSVDKSRTASDSVQNGTKPPISVAQMLRPVAAVISLALVTQLIAVGLISMLPVYLVDQRQVSPVVAAMLLGLMRGGGVIGAPLGGYFSDRLGRKKSIFIAIIAVGLLLFLTTITAWGIFLLILLPMLGLATAFKQPSVQSLLTESVPFGRQSTTLGFYFFFAAEGRSLMVPLIGYLMDAIGLTETYMVMSIAGVACSLTAAFLLKKGA